jgi:hypothetical protein
LRPTGNTANQCPAPFAKIFRFTSKANHLHMFRHPGPIQRGVSRSSRTLGRDAMDAGGAKDESVVLRTAKPCGPDTPTLVSSSREASFLGMTVARKPGHRGERGISRKPPRREGRIASAEPVCSCAFYPIKIAHGTAGAARTRSSLRPLVIEGGNRRKARAHRAARSRTHTLSLFDN